jgi:hypothetical protein
LQVPSHALPLQQAQLVLEQAMQEVVESVQLV